MRDGKYVILCIDDDEDVRIVLKTVLEASGYTVDTASTAEDGLRIFKKSTPDLIIVDLMMEEIDAGANFVKELKALGGAAPIYMLSSMGDNLSMTVDCAELGLAGVFQKPIDNEMLLSILKTKLG